MVTWGISVLICLAVGTGLPAVVVYALFRRRKAMNLTGKALVEFRFAGQELLLVGPVVELLGREGQAVVRGQGNMGVGRTTISYYSFYANGTLLNIPMENVRSVEVVDQFQGQRRLGQKLLKITFEESGVVDSAAFLVDNPAKWKKVLDGLRQS